MIQNADAEIARMRRIIAETDALEAEFDRVKHIHDVIRRLKARVDDVEARFGRDLPLASQRSGYGSSHRYGFETLQRLGWTD